MNRPIVPAQEERPQHPAPVPVPVPAPNHSPAQEMTDDSSSNDGKFYFKIP